MGVSPWYSDYRDNPDNYLIVSGGELDYPLGFSAIYSDVIQVQPHRAGRYTISRELDAPAYDDNVCAWVHARHGEFAGISWEGFCPPTFPGVVDGASIGAPPSYSATSGPAHGGDAQENVAGHAVWVHRVYDRIPTFGVLGFPDPEAMGYPADAVLEIEGDATKPDLAKIEFTGDDGFRPPLDSGALPVNVDTLDTHLTDPPTAVVPSGFDSIAGSYTQWPLGGVSGLYTYTDGDPDWQLLAESPPWDYFNFPEGEEPPYVPADYLFGSAPEHENVPNGSGSRDGYAIAVKFTFRAPRYRWITPGGTIPPRRIRQRGDGLTGGARSVRASTKTRQGGNRTIGGIL